jgi:hypothetical protein
MTPLTLVTPRIANQPLAGAPHVYAEPRRPVTLSPGPINMPLSAHLFYRLSRCHVRAPQNRLKPQESSEFPQAREHPA